jgi:hypothetical protein
MLPLLAEQAITWVKVDRPVFDLVGVVLSSLGLAGICAGVALGLGTALGIASSCAGASWDLADACPCTCSKRRPTKAVSSRPPF